MPSKIKSQPKNPQELQKWLESQGIKVRPQSEWGQTLRRLQRQANATGETHQVQISIPVRPQPSRSDYLRSGGQGYSAPVNRASSNRPPKPPLAGAGGPGPGYVPDNPYARRPQAQQANRHFPSPQPSLPAPEAAQLRNQYAQATSQGGNFTTGTNQGLLDLLQQVGIKPTPLNQWGQYLQAMRR